MAKRFSWEWFTLGVALGAVLTSAWFLSETLPPSAPATSANAVSATSTGLVGTPGGAVEVSDQAAGDSVSLASVTVPPPGVWVAIRDVNGSELGNVLGAALAGGPRSGFVVPLLRATEPGKTYAVEFYRDDGDDAFDLEKDSVYVDFDSGQRVVDYFTAN
jgi:hypothetical protein